VYIKKLCLVKLTGALPQELAAKYGSLFLIELPQFNTIFSRILAYSQDFITLDMDLTV
jgi:hypothetical protein